MRSGPAIAGGAGLSPGSAADLRAQAATLWRLATETTAAAHDLATVALVVARTGESPLRERLDSDLARWARLLEHDAEVLRHRAVWLDHLAVGEPGRATPPPGRAPRQPAPVEWVGRPPTRRPPMRRMQLEGSHTGAVPGAWPGPRAAEGTALEVEDSAFPLLAGVTCSTTPSARSRARTSPCSSAPARGR
ncbi:hypothetical protein MXD58_017635, partial [Frankia sp. AgKG'84/4]|nr:hypothetical protein [Frankia sp. AgKG'84/4]